VLHPPILYRTSGGPVPLLEMHRRPALWMAGVAFAGVVGGHTIAYFAAVPDASRRGALLAQTGHSYWRTALVAALLVEVLALAAVAARHFRAGLAIPARGPLPIRIGRFQLAVRLALIQVAAFTGLEVGERLVSRIPVAGMFANHVFALGVAIQVLVAGAGALLLRWLARAAEALGFCLRRPAAARPAGTIGLPGGPDEPCLRFLCESSRGRAPPPGAPRIAGSSSGG